VFVDHGRAPLLRAEAEGLGALVIAAEELDRDL